MAKQHNLPYQWTDNQIVEFRELYKKALTMTEIAHKFNTSRHSLDILRKRLGLPLRGTNWLHRQRLNKYNIPHKELNTFRDLDREYLHLWEKINTSKWGKNLKL